MHSISLHGVSACVCVCVCVCEGVREGGGVCVCVWGVPHLEVIGLASSCIWRIWNWGSAHSGSWPLGMLAASALAAHRCRSSDCQAGCWFPKMLSSSSSSAHTSSLHLMEWQVTQTALDRRPCRIF